MTRSHRGGDIRVVIVDDDVAQLEPLAQLLRDNDLEVHATSDSGAAVDLVVAVEPAVVILDVHMPEPDGFEVCRRLQESIEPPPAVIFLSGDEDTARLIEGLEVGAIDYVSKGADVRGLVAKVRAIAELASRLRELAVHALQDPLTEVGNRRAFDEEGAAMLAAARRHRRTLSCLAIDLDRFKAVNDRHGHAVGDAVLVAVARRMREVCRESDRLFRVGGEEFVLMAPETSAREARVLGNRLRAAVNSEPVRCEDLQQRALELRVTITVGVADSIVAGDLDELLARADVALYQGKRAGRDRVVLAAGGPAGRDRGVAEAE